MVDKHVLPFRRYTFGFGKFERLKQTKIPSLFSSTITYFQYFYGNLSPIGGVLAKLRKYHILLAKLRKYGVENLELA